MQSHGPYTCPFVVFLRSFLVSVRRWRILHVGPHSNTAELRRALVCVWHPRNRRIGCVALSRGRVSVKEPQAIAPSCWLHRHRVRLVVPWVVCYPAVLPFLGHPLFEFDPVAHVTDFYLSPNAWREKNGGQLQLAASPPNARASVKHCPFKAIKN